MPFFVPFSMPFSMSFCALFYVFFCVSFRIFFCVFFYVSFRIFFCLFHSFRSFSLLVGELYRSAHNIASLLWQCFSDCVSPPLSAVVPFVSLRCHIALLRPPDHTVLSVSAGSASAVLLQTQISFLIFSNAASLIPEIFMISSG